MVARTEFAIDVTIDPRRVRPGLRAVDRQIDKTEQKASELRQELTRSLALRDRGLNRTLKGVERGLARSEQRALSLKRALVGTLGTLGLAFGGGALVRGLVQTGDAFTTLQNRVRTVTTDQEQLNETFNELSAIAGRTRQRVGPIVQLFQRGSIASKQLGINNKELLGFTEKVGKALAVQGGAAGTSAGALLQLSQALSSGVVRAEEFNSILEGAFPIAEAAARGIKRFGGDVSKLRGEIIKGTVSSREFFDGFVRGSDLIEQRFASTTGKVSEAVGVLGDRFTRFFGEFDQAAGVTSKLAESILALSKNLAIAARVATDLAIVFGIRLAQKAIPAAIAAFQNLGATTVLTDVSGGLGLVTKETTKFSAKLGALNLAKSLINPFTLAIVAVEGLRSAYADFIMELEASESTLERVGRLATLFGGISVGGPPELAGISTPSGIGPAQRPAAPTLAAPPVLEETKQQASSFQFLAEAIESAKEELALFVREQERVAKVNGTLLGSLREENELLMALATNNEDLIRQKRIEIELRRAGAFATQEEIAEAIRLQKENEALRANLVTTTTFAEGVRGAFVELRREAADLAAVGDSVVNAFANRATDALVEFAKTGQLSFREFASAVLEDLIRIIARLLIVQALSAFAPGAGAAGSALSGVTANIGRQRGGTVQPGQAVKVGEGGMEELFVPDRTGTVVPTGAIAAAAAAPQEPPRVTIINQTDPDETAEELDSGNLDEQVLNVIARNPERARTLMGRT